MGDLYLGAKWTPADEFGSTWKTVDSRGGQFAKCNEWLATVKTEADTPELRAALKGESELLVAEVVEEEDRRFTDDERRQLLDVPSGHRSNKR